MMKGIMWGVSAVLLGCSNMLYCRSLSIPQGVLVGAGLDAGFIAKFTLFIAVLLLWTVIISKVFKLIFYVPMIAGQIIAGILLGPSVINIAGVHYFAESIQFVDQITGKLYALASSDLFLFFVLLLSSSFTVGYLLWLAGHETNIKDLLTVGFSASSAGILGALVPIGMTTLVALYLGPDYNVITSVGLGICLAATSISIPVAMLFSQNKMHLRSSKAMLGAAIIDDIFAILLLSLYFIAIDMGLFGKPLGFVTTGHHAGLFASLGYLALAFIILLGAGYYGIRPLVQWLYQTRLSHLVAPVAHGVMFLYFALAEIIGGLAGITGAYFAGLFHRMSDHRHNAEKSISPFVNSVLLPLFLCSIGLQVDIKVLSVAQWLIVLILLLVAIVSKLVGCFVATYLSNVIYGNSRKKWTLLESYIFGASMIPRGEVGLVVSTVLNAARIVTPEQYVIAVIVIVLTTIFSPIMISIGFSYEEYRRPVEIAPVSLNLGLFDVIGTRHLYRIILGRVESLTGLKTNVRLSEGREIATVRDYDVKIILCPDVGILFEGNKNKVNEIINMVRDAVQKELDRCIVTQE